MKDVNLKLRAWHFSIADFDNPCACAISFAAMEHFSVNNAAEGIDELTVANTIYAHEKYEDVHFESDFEKALAANFSNKVIRTIKLIPKWKKY